MATPSVQLQDQGCGVKAGVGMLQDQGCGVKAGVGMLQDQGCGVKAGVGMLQDQGCGVKAGVGMLQDQGCGVKAGVGMLQDQGCGVKAGVGMLRDQGCGVKAGVGITVKVPGDADVVMKEVIEVILEEVGRGGGNISDEQMSALHSIFQHNLVSALDLVDCGTVTRYVCHTRTGDGDVLWQVEGSGGGQYICLQSSSYCSCPAFVYSVLGRGDSALCKHQLAARLGSALGRWREVELSEKDWARMADLNNQQMIYK